MKKRFINLLLIFLFVIFCSIILALSIRGLPGSPMGDELNQNLWKDNGPLELSPERGRFALTYSLIEDRSFYYSLPIARFATPDLGYKNGNYVSLFAPGVSFIVLPGYLLGRVFNLSQVGTFGVVALFAVLNAILIRVIAIRIGAGKIAASLGSLIYIFATPSFAYSVTVYQHQFSVFCFLISIYILMKFQKIWSLALVWFFAAVAISIDYPNFFMMLPINLYALGRFFVITKKGKSINLNIKVFGTLTFLGAFLPLLFFLWFNKVSYGNPFQLAGTVAGVQEIDQSGKPVAPKNAGLTDIQNLTNPDLQQKSAVLFFKTKHMLTSLTIHFFSLDRGIVFYTPAILFGFWGMVIAVRRKMKYASLLIAVVLANIVLYSMWGDYWGGWAFGSRYMIPAYAILAVFIGVFLSSVKRKSFILLFFWVLLIYSVAVNALGAITTNANPPQVEVLALEKTSGIVQKYTYERNLDFLKSGKSKSFIFQTFANKYVTSFQYYLILVLLITIPSTALIILLRILKGKE